MPTLKPKKEDKAAVVALVAFISRWIASDPVRAKSLKGAPALLNALRKSAKDIEDSIAWPDAVELTDDAWRAFLYFVRLFVYSPEASDATVPVLADWSMDLQPKEILVGPPSRVGSNSLQLADRDPRRVFLVYGRDRTALLEVERWLGKLGLSPQVVEGQESAGSATVAEALEDKLLGCGTAIVLLTADDFGRLKGTNTLQPRARQNVILELGLLWGLIGRERLILLIDEVLLPDFPTDNAGFMTIRFKSNVTEAFDQLRSKLQHMGVIAVSSLADG